uniref:Uncharacterized protein AlNc14C59G4358 n=1 Tax=Albugo laibachii Nc14 TaxID=890382 RepID=F0WCH8_9STRA|nr:conserved hypothetical protein [Albugo laibachii Nc14]|eukprot:CCA18895.1 conserved hypothetical protein [Albugo laibachii Nc14]
METLTSSVDSKARSSTLRNLCDYAAQLASSLGIDRSAEEVPVRTSDCDREQNWRPDATLFSMLIRRNDVPLPLEESSQESNAQITAQRIETVSLDESNAQNYPQLTGMRETIDITDDIDTTMMATDDPIDLTRSPSDSECEIMSIVQEIYAVDDEVHIIAPNSTDTNLGSGRKRRRVGLGSIVRGKKLKGTEADTHNDRCAASNGVSIENAEIIEQFKNSLKCSICLDLIDRMTSTICGHVFCRHCIRSAIRSTSKCPLCQRKLRIRDIHGLFF